MKLPERLPQLTGAWLLAFKIVWVLALLQALILPLVGAYTLLDRRENHARPFMDIGLDYETRDNVHLVLQAPYGPEAQRSGIRDGDAVVAVDGRPVPQLYELRGEVAAAIRAAPAPVVRLTTRSMDGSTRDHLLSRGPHHEAEVYGGGWLRIETAWRLEAYLPLVAVAVTIVAAALLFRRRPGDPVASLMSPSLLLMTLIWGGRVLSQFGLLLVWTPFSHAAFAGFAVAITTFPTGRFDPKWTVSLTALACLWAVTSYTALALTGREFASLYAA